MKHIPLFLFTIFSLLSLFTCSTSQGSLFKNTYDSDKGRDSSNEIVPDHDDHTAITEDIDYPFYDDEYEDEEGLYIISNPPGADVYLDSKYKGITPLFLANIKINNYKLELRLPGYYPYKDWIYYSGGYMKYSTILTPVTGYLQLDVSPEDTLIYIENDRIAEGVTELRVGSYNLHVKKFGYNDYNETITIHENQTTLIHISLKKAAFSLSDLRITRKVLNPKNPGALGKTNISFYVTSFGKGTLTIEDTFGEDVFVYSMPEFQTWLQVFEWDGRYNDKTICPDGEYIIRINTESIENHSKYSLSESISIDSSYTISFRSLWNGTSGLIYTGTADVLPAASFQVSTLISAHIEDYDDEILMRAPTQLTFRFGIGHNIELDILAGLILTDTDYLPFIGNAAVKYQIFKTRGIFSICSAAYVKATYHSGTGADTFSNYTGLSLGVPFQTNAGPFSFILNPEIIISPYSVTYTSDYDAEPALNIWGYGRCGIMLDLGTIFTGFSCAVRTTSFLEDNLSIHYPLLGAYELHLMIPGSNLYVSLISATEFESLENFYFMGGMGLGFIF